MIADAEQEAFRKSVLRYPDAQNLTILWREHKKTLHTFYNRPVGIFLMQSENIDAATFGTFTIKSLPDNKGDSMETLEVIHKIDVHRFPSVCGGVIWTTGPVNVNHVPLWGMLAELSYMSGFGTVTYVANNSERAERVMNAGFKLIHKVRNPRTGNILSYLQLDLPTRNMNDASHMWSGLLSSSYYIHTARVNNGIIVRNNNKPRSCMGILQDGQYFVSNGYVLSTAIYGGSANE